MEGHEVTTDKGEYSKRHSEREFKVEQCHLGRENGPGILIRKDPYFIKITKEEVEELVEKLKAWLVLQGENE